MKVVIVMPLGDQRGGGELMLVHLMQQGLNRGIEWLVVFLQDGPLVEKFSQMGVKTWVIPSGRLRAPHTTLQCVSKIRDVIRQERADAVLSWMSKSHLYGGSAALFAKVPALWYQVHAPTHPHWIDRLSTMMPARGVITLSKVGFQSQHAIWPHRPGRLVYPGVELERFDPEQLPSPGEVRQKLALPTKGPLVGIVGRLQRWKGMHTLVQAMPQILKSYPDCHAVLVGGVHDLEPDYPAFLEKQIQDLGLKDRVIVTGLQRNIPEWMQAMDVVVHASDAEPFGIVVIEAMALGKPLVAGAEGGPVEIITPDVNGLLAPFEDADALTTAVLRYLDDPEFASRIGAAARRRASEFSTRHYAENLIAAVCELVGGTAVPGSA